MPDGSRYRILSLDGGGTWSIVEVRALMRLFGDDARGHDVLREFDLAAANSAGSIVLAGLIEDTPLRGLLADLLDPEVRGRIFRPTIWNRLGVAGFLPRWSAAEKPKGLALQIPEMGGKRLDEIPALIGGRRPQILIIGFDYDRLRATFFRSDPASRAANLTPFWTTTLLQAVDASSDAPVRYFDAPVTIRDDDGLAHRYWDGGVGGYNNPVLAAVTEALANGHARDAIDVLSIGTGSTLRPLANAGVEPPLGEPIEDQSLVHDFEKLAAAILDDPPDAASFIAHVALGGDLPAKPGEAARNCPIVRMNPVARPVREGDAWVLPRDSKLKRDFARLVDLDMDVVAQPDVELVDRFAAEWCDDIWPNQAIRSGADFACEVGHASFGAAAKAWQERIGR